MMQKTRSVGVILFGIFFLIFALINLIGNIPDATQPFAKIIGYLIVALEIICGIGILMLCEWTRKLVIYLMAACILGDILTYHTHVQELLKTMLAPSLFMAHLIAILRPLIEILIIFFFTRHKVKEQFKQSNR